MDQNLFEKGLAQRKATLGADYVESHLTAADAFTDQQRGVCPKHSGSNNPKAV